MIRQEPGPDRAVGGSTSAAAAAAGIPAIIAEAGGCGLVERAAVDAHVRGLDRILAALGMTGRPQGPRRPRLARPKSPPTSGVSYGCAARTRAGGAGRQPGEAVAEGQLLGTVSSLDGARLLQTITAPAAGVPMFITSSPPSPPTASSSASVPPSYRRASPRADLAHPAPRRAAPPSRAASPFTPAPASAPTPAWRPAATATM